MKTLVIVAHGSRRQDSNDEVAALARDLASLAGNRFDRVDRAFIQFTAPLLDDQIDAMVSGGASSITLFPYFIASGSHVVHDIPEVVRKARERHPGVEFTLLPHLGRAPGMTEFILRQIL